MYVTKHRVQRFIHGVLTSRNYDLAAMSVYFTQSGFVQEVAKPLEIVQEKLSFFLDERKTCWLSSLKFRGR